MIIIGVSGCGKTTIGKLLADKIQLPFIDADDFHPEENIQKMTNGIALTDQDRLPWLQNINAALKNYTEQKGAILACSALKESYRTRLSEGIDAIDWIYLQGDIHLIRARMERRANHFMDVNLLQSQFETLEEPSHGLHISVEKSPEEIVTQILHKTMHQ